MKEKDKKIEDVYKFNVINLAKIIDEINEVFGDMLK